MLGVGVGGGGLGVGVGVGGVGVGVGGVGVGVTGVGVGVTGVGVGVTGVGVGVTGVGVGVTGVGVGDTEGDGDACASSATIPWLITFTICVGSRGFVVVVAANPPASFKSSCFCSSNAIKSKLAGGSGFSKPIKKSELFTNFAMSKVNTFEKLLPSVVTIFPGPTSTD